MVYMKSSHVCCKQHPLRQARGGRALLACLLASALTCSKQRRAPSPSYWGYYTDRIWQADNRMHQDTVQQAEGTAAAMEGWCGVPQRVPLHAAARGVLRRGQRAVDRRRPHRHRYIVTTFFCGRESQKHLGAAWTGNGRTRAPRKMCPVAPCARYSQGRLPVVHPCFSAPRGALDIHCQTLASAKRAPCGQPGDPGRARRSHDQPQVFRGPGWVPERREGRSSADGAEA